MSSEDKKKKIREKILNELENGAKTYEYLSNKIGTNVDFRVPLATLLRDNEVRISGFDSYHNDIPRKNFAQKYILFEKASSSNKLAILRLFNNLESNDIDKSDKALKELLNKFKIKFKEYQIWETKTLNDIKKCVGEISAEKLIQELERIIKDIVDSNEYKVEENMRDFIEFILPPIKSLDYSKTKTSTGYYNRWLADFKKSLEKENITHIYYLKSESCCAYPKVLPPGFPKYRPKYINSYHSLKPEECLNKFGYESLPKGLIEVEDVFYDLILRIDLRKDPLIRNTLINCLSTTSNEEERIKKLKDFGRILDELGYISTDIFAEYTEYMDKFKNKDNPDIDTFLEFLKQQYNTWKKNI